MSDINLVDLANQFISDSGIDIGKFFIEITPHAEMVCFVNEEGREFDLPISNAELAKAVVVRLKELKVNVIELK
jgi:hypothetical protein